MLISLHWCITIVTGLIIAVAIFKERSVLIKPSFLCCTFYFLQVQIAGSVSGEKISHYFSDGELIFLITQFFPFILLIVSLLFMRRRYSLIFETAKNSAIGFKGPRTKIFFALIPLSLILFWYISTVTVSKTGLYATFIFPELASEYRENAFEELRNPALKYGYYFVSNSLAPIIAVLSIFLFMGSLNKTDVTTKLLSFYIILFVLLSVSLYGARGPSAMIVLAMVYAVSFARGFPIKPLKIVLVFLFIVAIPTIISLNTNSEQYDLTSLFEAFFNISNRIFIRGFEPNIWYLDKVNNDGYWGISGIPKLAQILGEEPVNVANVISLQYDKFSLKTGTANASYIVQYYSFFGLYGILVATIGLLFLDLLICVVLPYIKREMWMPFISVLIIPWANLSFTQFTTLLLTKGVFFIIIVSIFLPRLPIFVLKKRRV